MSFCVKRVKTKYFQQKWIDLQKFCADKKTWSLAIIKADDLLGEALKKRKFNGKNIGEKLVVAQPVFSDNELVWFGHKLRGKIDQDPEIKMKENEVKKALIGIKQALKDLGAL